MCARSRNFLAQKNKSPILPNSPPPPNTPRPRHLPETTAAAGNDHHPPRRHRPPSATSYPSPRPSLPTTTVRRPQPSHRSAGFLLDHRPLPPTTSPQRRLRPRPGHQAPCPLPSPSTKLRRFLPKLPAPAAEHPPLPPRLTPSPSNPPTTLCQAAPGRATSPRSTALPRPSSSAILYQPASSSSRFLLQGAPSPGSTFSSTSLIYALGTWRAGRSLTNVGGRIIKSSWIFM